MRVLVVGAGAVGQVYARHLALGGADVSFLVKEKYAEEARGGFALYPLNQLGRRRREPVRFEGFGVLTSAAEVEAAAGERPWDHVLLCVSTTALRAGTWLDELLPAVGEATVVSFQPGIEDRAYVEERMGAGPLAGGIINMISYPAPLPSESVPTPGVAYYLPPGRMPLSGPRERLAPLVAAFEAGGYPARHSERDVSEQGAVGSAVLMPLIASLEGAGWSFAGVRGGDHLELASGATREIVFVVAHRTGIRPSRWLDLVVRPAVARLVTRIAPLVFPFDVETYLQVHFTKVGDQTRYALATYRRLAQEAGTRHEAVDELARRLGEG